MELRKGHQRGVVTIIASVLVVMGLATTPPLASGREASIYGKTMANGRRSGGNGHIRYPQVSAGCA
jgi:hypothetical protein